MTFTGIPSISFSSCSVTVTPVNAASFRTRNRPTRNFRSPAASLTNETPTTRNAGASTRADSAFIGNHRAPCRNLRVLPRCGMQIPTGRAAFDRTKFRIHLPCLDACALVARSYSRRSVRPGRRARSNIQGTLEQGNTSRRTFLEHVHHPSNMPVAFHVEHRWPARPQPRADIMCLRGTSHQSQSWNPRNTRLPSSTMPPTQQQAAFVSGQRTAPLLGLIEGPLVNGEARCGGYLRPSTYKIRAMNQHNVLRAHSVECADASQEISSPSARKAAHEAGWHKSVRDRDGGRLEKDQSTSDEK